MGLSCRRTTWKSSRKLWISPFWCPDWRDGCTVDGLFAFWILQGRLVDHRSRTALSDWTSIPKQRFVMSFNFLLFVPRALSFGWTLPQCPSTQGVLSGWMFPCLLLFGNHVGTRSGPTPLKENGGEYSVCGHISCLGCLIVCGVTKRVSAREAFYRQHPWIL